MALELNFLFITFGLVILITDLNLLLAQKSTMLPALGKDIFLIAERKCLDIQSINYCIITHEISVPLIFDAPPF